MELPVNKIIFGSALEVLKTLPDNSINCCISSPPYWGLRVYGTEPQIWDGDKNCEHNWQDNSYVRNNDKTASSKQKTNNGSIGRDNPISSDFCSKCGAWKGELGLEPTFELYLKHLLTIYDEVKRVLRKDGTCFVNLGDTYGTHTSKRSGQFGSDMSKDINSVFASKRPNVGLEKSLCMIPERFAIGMIERGWILRNKLIWHKPNPMPSSARDRFTVDFEPVFFFSKNKQYFFEPQYEELSESTATDKRTIEGNYTNNRPERDYPCTQNSQGSGMLKSHFLGRNKRCVWTIPTQACKEAHFATYPEKLVQPMIEAGCPLYVCDKCGKPRKKIYGLNVTKVRKPEKGLLSTEKISNNCDNKGTNGLIDGYREIQKLFKGYSDCECNAGFSSGIVLDPFAGSGTTCYVAAKLKRDYIGIELNPKYIQDIARYRMQEAETSITVQEQRQGQIPLFESV